MSPDRVRALACVFAIALLHGCVREALVGENTADGLGDDASTGTVIGLQDQDGGPTKFDVSAERIVAPTWRYDSICDEPCPHASHVAVAPDGTVWAALLGGQVSPSPGRNGPVRTDSMFFARLDSDGKELARYSYPLTDQNSSMLEGGSPLLFDQQGQPYALRWPMLGNQPYPPVRAFRLEGEELLPRPLPGAFYQSDTLYIAGFPDGSFMEFASQTELRAVHYAASGETLWKTHDLRAVPDNSGSRRAIAGPVYLSDGSIVLDELQKPENGYGLTVLGPDGQVRWDMQYWLSQWPFKKLAAGLLGALVIAGITTSEGDLGIYVYDREGSVVRSFRGARVGYHAVAPRALGVDENGDVYVALIVGERNRPRLSVCKLAFADAGDTSARQQSVDRRLSAREQNENLPARCVALDFVAPPERSENAITYPFLNVQMAVAEVGAVVLVIAHQQDDDVATSIVRVDLDAPAAQPVIAP